MRSVNERCVEQGFQFGRERVIGYVMSDSIGKDVKPFK